MAKSADKAYGAESRGGSTMLYDPKKLTLIKDREHRFYDARIELPLKEEVVASIMLLGVQNPVQVWKDRETGEVFVVDGLQRVKNAIEANRRLVKDGLPAKQIPGVALKGTREHAFAVKVLLNGGRQDPTPLDQARLAERLLSMGYDERTTGTILHLTPGTLKNYRALLECSAPVKKAVEEGLPVTFAYKLAKLEPAEQREQLAKMLKASEGVHGKKKRAKKMRAATGEIHPRSKHEIAELTASLKQDTGRGDRSQAWIDCLAWVQGFDTETPAVSPRELSNGVVKAMAGGDSLARFGDP